MMFAVDVDHFISDLIFELCVCRPGYYHQPGGTRRGVRGAPAHEALRIGRPALGEDRW